ncbi:MAG: helical backbone metal receptor [Campylobacterota bacterium]|nr:helical backbone metal receptor [Campylobacterota bacterium]
MSIRIFFIIALLILTLDAKERIVSLSPGITETLFALGVGDEVVGVSAYSTYPKAAQKLPVVGSYSTPTLEKIIALSPTLVIAQDFNTKTLRHLEKFNIETLSLTMRTLKDIKHSINSIAQRLSCEAEGKRLIDTINSAMLEAKQSQKTHSVLIVYGLQEDLRNGIYVAGHDIFFEDIIVLSGNTNAYTQDFSGQPVLNYENLIALNPEQVIILHSHQTGSHIDIQKALKNWHQVPIKAAKERRISIVDADYIHIPSHRVALSIRRLSEEMRYD